MKVNYVFLLIVLLAIPFCASQIYKCIDKSLFEDNYQYNLKSNDADINFANNEVASCATLEPSRDDFVCCYIKLKIKNTLYDETYTQKGCQEMNLTTVINEESEDEFSNLLDWVEATINEKNSKRNIEVKKLSIDCSSKFIQLAGISLLLLLL